MTLQDIKNEIVDYIRNSGESVEDYNVDMCADYMYDTLYLEGVDEYRNRFEETVFFFCKDE